MSDGTMPAPVDVGRMLATSTEMADLTPARVLVGRRGTSYRTSTFLALRLDHAFAKDALHERVDLDVDPLASLVERHAIIELATCAADLDEHLARPDLGRRLDPSSTAVLRDRGGVDVQIVIGDGLSAAAVNRQVPELLEPLIDSLRADGRSVAPPVFVRHCRVGVINDIGAAVDATDVVLLIGERPGLATSESLSIYLGHRPRPGDTDADRNLISNIHAAGVEPGDAVARVTALLRAFRLAGRSGFTVKEPDRPSPSVLGGDR